jgi:hypothetical protein
MCILYILYEPWANDVKIHIPDNNICNHIYTEHQVFLYRVNGYSEDNERWIRADTIGCCKKIVADTRSNTEYPYTNYSRDKKGIHRG